VAVTTSVFCKLCPATFCRSASAPPDPKAYLLKGEGEMKIRAAKLSTAARLSSPSGSCGSPTALGGSKRVETERLPSPPKAGATNVRANPPNSTFRKFYERGDLPISVDHKSFKNTIKWKVRRQKCRNGVGASFCASMKGQLLPGLMAGQKWHHAEHPACSMLSTVLALSTEQMNMCKT
jgi:hypothetical protein